MADDARDALVHLRDQCGVEHVGLVGTAAGATVAALVARDVPGAPVALWRPFEPASTRAFQFVESYDWIPAFGIKYELGIDGLSLILVVLTTTLTWTAWSTWPAGPWPGSC